MLDKWQLEETDRFLITLSATNNHVYSLVRHSQPKEKTGHKHKPARLGLILLPDVQLSHQPHFNTGNLLDIYRGTQIPFCWWRFGLNRYLFQTWLTHWIPSCDNCQQCRQRDLLQTSCSSLWEIHWWVMQVAWVQGRQCSASERFSGLHQIFQGVCGISYTRTGLSQLALSRFTLYGPFFFWIAVTHGGCGVGSLRLGLLLFRLVVLSKDTILEYSNRCSNLLRPNRSQVGSP